MQCPCHGDPGPRVDDSAIEGAAITIEKLVGDRPETCLWWQMRDEIVHETLALYRACRTDQGATPALLLPADPPNLLWEGVLHYVAALDRIRADTFKREEEERAKKKALRTR